MNAAHLHLMLNHVPVLAIPFGIAVLAWAMWRQRPEFARLAMTVFLLSAVATIPTYVTGEPAEDAIEGVAGTIEPWVEAHEEAALASLILGEALGLLALLGLWRGRVTAALSRPMLAASLALALVTAGSLAYTANLGGRIRHTELRSGATLSGAASVGRRSDMRVLIVEDDRLLGDALAAGLKQRGFQADWVQDGRDAQAAIRTEPLPPSCWTWACQARVGSSACAASVPAATRSQCWS